jgi:hypothetical protein
VESRVLWLLKDGDGLGRVRLGDLDPSRLRHDTTREWIQAATRLFEATRDMYGLHSIWQQAARLGLPVAELIAYVQEQIERRLEPEEEGPKATVRPAPGW